MAPQGSQNCGRDFAKRKQTDAEFARNSLLRMVIIDIAINVLLSRVTRHPAGMHCPSWDDAFVSSFFLLRFEFVALCVRGVHSLNKHCVAVYRPISTIFTAFFQTCLLVQMQNIALIFVASWRHNF